MINTKNLIAAIVIGSCFSLQSFAGEKELPVQNDQLETQTLVLESADVSVLNLSMVQDEASENANEIHQESTLGRAGLAGACM